MRRYPAISRMKLTNRFASLPLKCEATCPVVRHIHSHLGSGESKTPGFLAQTFTAFSACPWLAENFGHSDIIRGCADVSKGLAYPTPDD